MNKRACRERAERDREKKEERNGRKRERREKRTGEARAERRRERRGRRRRRRRDRRRESERERAPAGNCEALKPGPGEKTAGSNIYHVHGTPRHANRAHIYTRGEVYETH